MSPSALDTLAVLSHICRVNILRVITVLLLCLGLAACGGSTARDPRPPAPPPPERSFLPVSTLAELSQDGTMLMVAVRTGLSDHIETVLLLPPDDRQEAVLSRDFYRREVSSSGDRGRPVVGVSGGSSSGISVGVGFDLTPLFSDLPASDRGRYRIWEAELPLSDPADYQENWRAYAIEVQYRDVLDDPRILRIRAPRP